MQASLERRAIETYRADGELLARLLGISVGKDDEVSMLTEGNTLIVVIRRLPIVDDWTPGGKPTGVIHVQGTLNDPAAQHHRG